jgi:hypothetical protein
MREVSMKSHKVSDKVKMQVKQWGMLLAGLLLACSLAFSPTMAQAATGAQAGSEGWFPHLWGGAGFPGFWLTGEVTKVGDGSVTVQLPNHRATHGMMRFLSLQVTLDVDSSSVLLNADLGPLEVSSLAEGDEVVVVPGMVWGNLVARMLYAGDPKDLADFTHRGQLVADNGDTLTLKNGREGEFTVQVSDDTVWYDNGKMERPTNLAEEITLRVLGVTEKNDKGDEVIRAVVITPER